MSQIALSPPATGTGVFTISAPATNTNQTLTLPDATGTVTTSEAVTAAGYTTPAAVKTQFNASGSAPVYACRAWVNFNGTGTVAIRASGNVSSITDNGVGDYTVNFTTAMQDVDYSFSGAGRDGASPAPVVAMSPVAAPTAAALRVTTIVPNIATRDTDYVNVSIFR